MQCYFTGRNILYIKSWIPNLGVLGSKPQGGFNSTRPFVFPRLIKLIPVIPGCLVEVCTRSDSLAFRWLNPIYKKGPGSFKDYIGQYQSYDAILTYKRQNYFTERSVKSYWTI